MNKHFILCTLIISLFSASCKKAYRNHVDVTIKVVDEKTFLPIRDAKVVLLKSRGVSGVNATPMQEYTSDSKGQVVLDFEGEEGMDYFAAVSRHQYFDNFYDPFMLKKGAKNKISYITLKPKGYVKIHIKNVPPASDWDGIEFGTFCISKPLPLFGGAQIDTAFLYENYCGGAFFGGEEFSLGYHLLHGSDRTAYRKEIFIPAFDTAFVEIIY